MVKLHELIETKAFCLVLQKNEGPHLSNSTTFPLFLMIFFYYITLHNIMTAI